jgi:hypothetical protein
MSIQIVVEANVPTSKMGLLALVMSLEVGSPSPGAVDCRKFVMAEGLNQSNRQVRGIHQFRRGIVTSPHLINLYDLS